MSTLPVVLRKEPRPRIRKGRLVYSTNKVQHGLAQDLIIIQYYRPASYKRVKRIVLHPN